MRRFRNAVLGAALLAVVGEGRGHDRAPAHPAEGALVLQPVHRAPARADPARPVEEPEGTPGPGASLPVGAPHFTLGMLKEFTAE